MMVSCMTGPDLPRGGYCQELYDADLDLDVDLHDWQAFQNLFGTVDWAAEDLERSEDVGK